MVQEGAEGYYLFHEETEVLRCVHRYNWFHGLVCCVTQSGSTYLVRIVVVRIRVHNLLRIRRLHSGCCAYNAW